MSKSKIGQKIDTTQDSDHLLLYILFMLDIRLSLGIIILSN